MRRNPLTRDAFAGRSSEEALRAITDRVNGALVAMNERQTPDRCREGARLASILMRVDIRRHDPKLVASDLGLSARQFFRERRLAHERFCDAYGAHPARTTSTDRADFATRLLERAGSLADSGETSSARAILSDVAHGGDAAARCEGLVRLAELDAWGHDFKRARAHLHAADAILAEAPLAADRRRKLQDASEAVFLILRWFAQGPAAVEGCPERMIAQAEAGRTRGNIRTTVVRATAALRSGEASYAARLLRQVDGEASACSPDVAVDILTLRAELVDFRAEDPLVSERLLARAAALAHSHGLSGRELYAKHQLYSARWIRSRNSRDRSAYRNLLNHTDRFLPPRLRSHLAFCASDIEIAVGHPSRALQAAEAAAAVATNTYETVSARGLAAGALLRLGRITDAGAQASWAAEVARSGGHSRVVALAQRISAQAHLALGNRRSARSAIEESIECARRFSSAHVISQAQAVLGRITGRSPE